MVAYEVEEKNAVLFELTVSIPTAQASLDPARIISFIFHLFILFFVNPIQVIT
jgi:hypothetical protein